MNYTSNYHLPQWEQSDRVLMEDFNQMCLDIESGIDGAVQHGTDAANQAQSTVFELATKAQATADSAVSKAAAAQQTADQSFKPGYLPYQVGSYTGNGGSLSVSVGFRPSFVIVSDGETYTVITGGDTSNLKLTGSGMTVIYGAPPAINVSGRPYHYIAFR